MNGGRHAQVALHFLDRVHRISQRNIQKPRLKEKVTAGNWPW